MCAIFVERFKVVMITFDDDGIAFHFSSLSFFRFFTHMEEEQKRVEIVEKTNVEWKLVGKHKFSEEKKKQRT